MEKQKEGFENNREILDVKNAVHQRSTPEGIPPGLEDAPSPTEAPAQKEEREVPVRDISHMKPTFKSQSQPIQHTNFQEPSPERASYDMIEEIAESIVGEKWDELIRGFGDLKLWKEKMDTDLAGTKQEILRVQNRFENLQKAVLGKVSEYGEGIQDLGAEIKALEKVLGNIIAPLTKNIKDLERVTQKIK
jgi:hypothetical protein